jgi:hypothetical protein
MKNFVLFWIILFAILLHSCSGSKVQIKPEQTLTEVKHKDTVLTTPRKLFSEQTQEMTIDTVIIPKRKKSEKQPQIILAPIILPITTAPVLQMPEQKLDKFTTEEKSKQTPETQPHKTELTLETKNEAKDIEKEFKSIETPKSSQPIEKEFKPIETPKISQPTEKPEYSIQIGAFVTQNSANEHLKNFKRLYPSKNAFIAFDSTSGFYKVKVNSIKDTTELEQIISLIRKNFPDAFIVPTVSKPELEVKSQFPKLNNAIKIQIGAYSQISQAMEIKNYIESKFKIVSEIIKSDKLYKVIIYLKEGDEDVLNMIKSEFPDAFLTK